MFEVVVVAPAPFVKTSVQDPAAFVMLVRDTAEPVVVPDHVIITSVEAPATTELVITRDWSALAATGSGLRSDTPEYPAQHSSSIPAIFHVLG